MIKLHPTQQQLQKFADGTIDPVMGLVVAAHVDMCECCQQQVAKFEEALSDDVFTISEDTILTSEMEQMMQTIMESSSPSEGAYCEVPHVELDGRFFQLPRALGSFAKRTDGWSHLVGKLWQSSAVISGDVKGHFVFLGPGAQVPEHTHKGDEVTLVIDGEFEDEFGLYKEGDFIVRNGEHQHTPKTVSANGCLVFTIVDEPLHFTSGVARLLNPFSHHFFS